MFLFNQGETIADVLPEGGHVEMDEKGPIHRSLLESESRHVCMPGSGGKESTTVIVSALLLVEWW